MPDVATRRTDGSSTPQRLDKILAALHYLLLHDKQVRDYRFTVDPADHHHILRNGFSNLTELNELLGLRVRFVRQPCKSNSTGTTNLERSALQPCHRRADHFHHERDSPVRAAPFAR